MPKLVAKAEKANAAKKAKAENKPDASVIAKAKPQGQHATQH